jgi:hypothetical protein
MNVVQPIRQISKIEEIKDLLRHQSVRDEFLFTLGINSGLRYRHIGPRYMALHSALLTSNKRLARKQDEMHP